MPYSEQLKAPYYVATGVVASGIGDVSPAWPTHVAGDIAILICESLEGEPVVLSDAQGFVEVDESQVPGALDRGSPVEGVGTGTRLTVFWCRATSAAMAAPTITDPGDHIIARIATFRNCIDAGTPFAGMSTGYSLTTATTQYFGAMYCSAANAILVQISTTSLSGLSTSVFSGWTAASSLGVVTEIIDNRHALGTGGGIGAAWDYLPPHPGSVLYGSRNVTGGYSAMMALALRPNPAPVVYARPQTGGGHVADANTLLHWKFDEDWGPSKPTYAYDLVTGNGLIQDTGTLSGNPGFSSYLLDSGATAFMRRFTRSAIAEQGDAWHATLPTHHGGTLAVCQASWTQEFFVRLREHPGSGTNPVVGVAGSGNSTSSIDNHQFVISSLPSGLLQVSWEQGSGVVETVTQSAGSGLSLDTLHHVAVTKNASTLEVEFWLDGALQDTVSYTNEPTGGTGARPAVGLNNDTGATGSTFGDFDIRYWSFSKIVRGSSWIAANAARKTTTGTLLADSDTHLHYPIGAYEHPTCLDASGNGLHGYEEGSGSRQVTYPTGLGGLIQDGGRGRVHDIVATRAHYDAAINAALISEFTVSFWYSMGHAVDSSVWGWGLWCHGNPGAEQSYNNYISAGITDDFELYFDAEHGGGSNAESSTSSQPGTFTRFGEAVLVTYRGRKYGTVYGDGGSTRMQINILINGELVHEGDILKPDGSNDSQDCYFAVGHGNTTPKGSGVFDDVHVSDIWRSDAEVLADFERGASQGGGTTYRMRANDGTLGHPVYWNSSSIDSGGAGYAGPGPLTGIVVSKVIGS